ncbi:hypothetical protein SLE2022_072910 [Rubroshorea leprosula]
MRKGIQPCPLVGRTDSSGWVLPRVLNHKQGWTKWSAYEYGRCFDPRNIQDKFQHVRASTTWLASTRMSQLFLKSENHKSGNIFMFLCSFHHSHSPPIVEARTCVMSFDKPGTIFCCTFSGML